MRIALAGMGLTIALAASMARADTLDVFNTGVDSQHQVLAPGNADPHYTLIQLPPTGTPPRAATVAFAHFAYAPNSPIGSTGSSWISAGSNTNGSWPPGTYVYRTTIDLTDYRPETAQLTFSFMSDDSLLSVSLNGNVMPINIAWYQSFVGPYHLTSGFQSGVNTLDFAVRNAGTTSSPTGFRALLSGTADPMPRDTTAPVISGVEDVTFECTGGAIAFSAESLNITALDETDGVVPVTLSLGEVDGLGDYSVTATAGDAAGNVATATFTVHVVDTTPPDITSLSASPDVIYADDDASMVAVEVTAVVTDICDPAPSVRIVSVEVQDAALGSGDTQNDYEITGDLTVNLRAKRSGRGTGRTYVITVEAVDASGNSSTGTVSVHVPHDRRPL